jgi:hypothetical protein
MQDDQIGPKIVGLAPADTARLPPSTITKKISSKQLSLSAGTMYTYFELTYLALQGKTSVLLVHSPSSH